MLSLPRRMGPPQWQGLQWNRQAPMNVGTAGFGSNGSYP
jgi:hypothetical protein